MVLMEVPVVKNGAYILNRFDESNDIKTLKRQARDYIRRCGFKSRCITLLDDPFLMEMLKKNPENLYRSLAIPTLYLAGTRERIIDHKAETACLSSFGNPNITIHTFDGLNHYLTDRTATAGMSLYLVDPEVLSALEKI